jgi:photosystem I reaction center subunit XII
MCCSSLWGLVHSSPENGQQPTKLAQANIAEKEKFMLSDTQVFLALFVSLITGVLAVRLGTQLYK